MEEATSEWLFGYPGGNGWVFPGQLYNPPQAEQDARLNNNRDEAIAGFCKSVESMARAGIHTLCYAFALNPCWGRCEMG